MAGAVFAFLGVALGAFAAHGLKEKLTPEMLAIFEVGARYHMYHALALFASAWVVDKSDSKAARMSGHFFVAGILLFSGSLYALALTDMKWLGAITPFGGMLFLTGWLTLVIASAKSKLA